MNAYFDKIPLLHQHDKSQKGQKWSTPKGVSFGIMVSAFQTRELKFRLQLTRKESVGVDECCQSCIAICTKAESEIKETGI
jgi:hypothetical protein